MNDGATIEIHDLKKIYRVGKVDVHALRGVDLTVNAGDFLSIIDLPARESPRCSTSSAV